ncbi:DUF907 domain-containing protein [Plectosphaerella plurivora]|uniref:DUF907 domain-containing protein n=1 Tax=Plectosphaerella plurivora TaxID=936078 RepID=A0A9P9AIN4_9PEZI|nr:DUF907 domain-containing protein [Plectosphaerella plurivora]
MRWSLPLLLFTSLASFWTPMVGAERVLQSMSLNSCQEESSFSATLFNVVFTPSNNSASINIVAVVSVQGSVVFDVALSVYGLQILRQVVDPCKLDLAGLCPMSPGNLNMKFNVDLGDAVNSQVPGIGYTIPDLDATVRAHLNLTETGESVACVEADISNGKTVDLVGVKWATAIIAVVGLISAAIVSGLGHTNAAAHLAANTLSLFGYFQAQAIIGLTGVKMPPIVRSWTQDFMWSMGIIRVGWMQDVFTWYQRSTGGTPATIFHSLRRASVQVAKRSLDYTDGVFKRGIMALAKRANIELDNGSFLVYGIQRVAFRAKIETTNLFITGLTFFCIFVVLTVIIVSAFKGICELCARQKWMDNERFLEFRNGWLTVLKGILFRLTLIGFPQITILSLWEFTQIDSPAMVVLAVFFFFGMLLTLGWASFKVIRIARRSVAMHRNPAYILFSDPQALNKWGFLYVQFRASAYYFIVPVLIYTLLKGIFIAFGQHVGVVQAVALIVIEAGALIAASVLRPWMDKSTNSFNIAIYVMNFLNAIFLLIFTNVFGAPGMVAGVVGVVLFVINAAFSLILLLMIIVSSTMIFWRKNPDARYQFMADDRVSFMKSQTQLNTTTELDALAATARGDKAGYKSQLDLDDDNDSVTSEAMRRRADPYQNMAPGSQTSHGNAPRSPVDPSVPLFPADNQRGPYSPSLRSQSPFTGSQTNLGPTYRAQNNASPSGFRQQNSASPWQRGAGYDH